MSAPLVLFSFSMLTVVLTLAFRNDARAASTLASVGTLISALFIFFVPIDQAAEIFGNTFRLEPAWRLLGRALVLDQVTQPMVGFLYLSASFLLLPAWLAGGSRYFPALAVVMSTAAGAALMARPFLYAAIFIEFTAIVAGLILVTRKTPRNLGALRLLTLYTLGMLIILITGWLLDQGGITSATTGMINRATMMMIFGIALLILVPPFHIWLINASTEANPYALSFVVITLQSSALFFLLRFLDVYPWLRENQLTFQSIRAGGMVCMIVGVLFAASQRDLRKVLAFMIVADIGFALLSTGVGTSAGYQLALGMTASRIVSLGVLSLGLSLLIEPSPGWPVVYDTYAGSVMARLAVFVGMLSLSGFPLTAGFPGRWSLMTVLMDSGSINAYLGFVAYLSLTVVTLWWGYKLFRGGIRGGWMQVNLENSFLLLGVAVIFLLGLFPQLTYPWIVELVSGLTRLFG